MEIDGNSRTHVTLSNSYSYFYYCDIIADGWAALSTDGSDGFVYFEANNCTVKTLKSGYGTYADGKCHVYINNSDFDVASMAGIIAGEADITFKDTKAKGEGLKNSLVCKALWNKYVVIHFYDHTSFPLKH